MRNRNQLSKLASVAAVLAAPLLLQAYSSGPAARVTGAPGDDPAACTECHVGTALNGGPGSIKIVLTGGATYTPGVKQRISVQVSDPSQVRWGFQFSARLKSDLVNGQAGDLSPADANTQVICDNGGPKPCPASAPVQFIEHTSNGTRNGTKTGVSFDFDWTPPATDVGPVVFYAAGNAANGNFAPTGDRIYTTNVTLTAASTGAPKPSISSGGVVNAASGTGAAIAPGTWISIFGQNFGVTAPRIWRGDEIKNGVLPTSLDGVSVTVNNKPAAVEFISAAQINVLTPDDTAAGPVQIVVTTPNGAADPVTAQLAAVSPEFFLFDGKYLAATHADSAYIGKAGLFATAPSLTTPAKPGEVVIFYGTGFGPTNPAMPAGSLVSKIAGLVTAPQITIGGIQANVSFAGLIPGFAGLYQFNVEIPSALGDGDQKVIARSGSVSSTDSAACCFVTVQR